MRTRNVGKVWDAVSQYSDHISGFDPFNWLLDDNNVALINEDDDVALFESIKPGVVFGHYFFFSRGRYAVRAASIFLREAFTDHNINVIEGLTPIDNKAARWMNRKLGFKSLGILDIDDPCELVLMTKQDWEDLYG